MTVEAKREVKDFDVKDIKTAYCIDLHTRDRQVQVARARVPGRLGAYQDNDERIAVVCFGPSLEDTWEELREFKYIITCSGSHRFLIDRGIIPTWHVEVDPRPHKAKLIGQPHPDVEYLVASLCHKEVFDLLEGFNVKLWHVFSDEAGREAVIHAFPRGEWMIPGGRHVGARAMTVARFLGFRDMVVFGMDHSFRPGKIHAAPHPNEAKEKWHYDVKVGDRLFTTIGAMHQYAQAFFKDVTKLGRVKIELRGDGLLQERVKEFMDAGNKLIPDTAKAAALGAITPLVASPEYIELQKQLHQERPDYGISGSKRIGVVTALVTKLKPKSILDYGCGKGTLAAGLPFPIWEYDPCIPGKDAPPRPAELVICTDVLEHVEPEYLSGTLLDLARATQKVCYAVIHTGPAQKTMSDGRNAHLIQEGKDWWKEKLGEFFNIASITEKGVELVVVMSARQVPAAAKPAPQPAAPRYPVIVDATWDGTTAKYTVTGRITEWRLATLFTKEPATMSWIESFKPGEVLYDVGANVGMYSIWAAKRRGVKVFAFEPEAQNYAVLVRNMMINDVDGDAHCLAVGSELKLAPLFLSAVDDGGSCHSFGAEIGPDLQPRPGIRQGSMGVSIDWLRAVDLPTPDHIKIDVDGLEHKVIEGMQITLRYGAVKSLLVEVNTNLPEHQKMLGTLAAAGFVYDDAQVRGSMRTDGPFKGVAEHVFTRMGEVERAVLGKILAAKVIAEPFPHIYVEDLFPADAYAALLAALPADADYKTLLEARGTANYPERFVAPNPELTSWMAQGRLRKMLAAKFGIQDEGAEDIFLVRDHAGYALGPHSDAQRKVMNGLIYLPHYESLIDAGTSLYVPKDADFVCPGGPHYEREKFCEVYRAPFKPNSALFFVKNDRSFHGVEPFAGPGVRDILLFNVSRKA